jgi:hypothetical protein
MATEVQTASEVIDALGGTGATARLTSKSNQAVSNWRATGKLPADTYYALNGELEKLGIAAPPTIWGMAGAERIAS